MLYKNAEIFNVEQLIENEDGSVSWIRVPEKVYNSFDREDAKRLAACATGVEIRFKMNCDKVTLKMSVISGTGTFHIYRGYVQGGWEDHEVNKIVTTDVNEFVIERSKESEKLKAMTEKSNSEWNYEVVRIIFDRGAFKIFDIIGDIEPPSKKDIPSKSLMCYGSSITHGSNSIGASHSWVSLLAHNIKYDVRNKGMAGNCCIEPEFVDYIAAEGKENRWNVLTLELGINVLDWEESKIYERVTYAIKTIAEANADKPIFVISPFYHCGEDFDKNDRTHIWRRIISEIVSKLNYKNVTYINGLDLLGDMTLISADFVHPNIYGVAQIADRLTEIVRKYI